MTTSNEQVTKLPLIKRIVLALRGGVGPGLIAVVVLVVLLLMVVSLFGAFMGGMKAGTSQSRAALQKLSTELRAAHAEAIKSKEALDALQKKFDEQTNQQSLEQNDVKMLKEQLTQAKMEHDAMDKVLAEIRNGLQGTGGKADDAKVKQVQKVIDTARVKFGNSECELANGNVSNKQDVKCLDLRNAIKAMNTAPGGYDDKDAKPADKKPK